jgi:hypothetical protein
MSSKSSLPSSCQSLLNNEGTFRVLFFLCIYVAAMLFYEIPYGLAPLFFVCQAGTYLVYFLLLSQTPCGPYLSTGVAAFVMVLISSCISHRLFPTINFNIFNYNILLLNNQKSYFIKIIVLEKKSKRKIYRKTISNIFFLNLYLQQSKKSKNSNNYIYINNEKQEIKKLKNLNILKFEN